MRLLTLIVILFTTSLSLFSQGDSFEAILQKSNDFAEIVSASDTYFKRKHPGLSAADLAEGPNRDSKFVKFQRWQKFWQDRLNPDGTLGDLSLPAKAFQKGNNQKSSTSPYAAVAWENINYTEYITAQIGMGRTTSMAFHPTDTSTFYVGAAIGGIWKTTDGGQSYVPLGDDLPFLAVSSIIVDQNTPSTIYIAVSDHVWYGPQGLGVYKSTDGGNSWVSTALAFDFTDNVRIYAMIADPNDPLRMYVATANGLYKTEDGFATVTRVRQGNFQDVRLRPGNSNYVYAAASNGKVLRSLDGGTTFTEIIDFGTRSVRLAVTPLDDQLVYARHENKLYRSTNAGASFSEHSQFTERNEVFIVAPSSASTILSGNFECHRSDDGGLSFNKISFWLQGNDGTTVHVDQRNMFVNPLEGDAVYYCNDGGVYRYNISANRFENLSNGLAITQFYDIAVSQSNPEVVSGGSQDNGNVFRQSDSSWLQYQTSGDGMNQEIDPTDENTRYYCFQQGSIRRWKDGVISSIKPVGASTGAWETPYKLDPSNPDRIVIGYRKIWESDDQGNSWNTISDALGNAKMEQLAIAPSNGERIYVTSRDKLYVKNTNNDEWTTRTLPSGRISDIEIDPVDMNKVYVSTPGYGAGKKIYVSYDAGANWTNISGGLPNTSVGALELYYDVPGAIFIGTDLGVFYKDDTNDDWLLYGDLPNTRVEDIEIQYERRLIRVGTHGRGIYQADVRIGEIPVLNQYVSVDDGPFQIGDTVTVCDGQQVKLGFGGNFGPGWEFTYTSPNGNFTEVNYGSSAQNIGKDQLLLQPSNLVGGGTYEGIWTVRYTNPGGVSNTTTFTVNVNSQPNVTSITKTDMSCEVGGSITFNFADIPSSGGIAFSLDGGSTYYEQVSGNSGSVTYRDLAPGTYDLFVRRGNNQCPVNLPDRTILSAGPITQADIALNADKSELCAGETTTLRTTISGSGTKGFDYNWQYSDDGVAFKDASAAPNASVWNLNADNVSNWLNGQRWWRVKVITESCGSITSRPVKTTIIAAPNLNQFISIDGGALRRRNTVTICEGQTVRMDLGGSFSTDWNFVYTRPDGATIAGGANSSPNDMILLPNNVDGGPNEGVWQVTYTNPQGCSNTARFTVNINSIPQVTTSKQDGNCGEDGSITFNFLNDPARSGIEFSIDGGTTFPYGSNDNAGSLTVSGLSAGTYELFTRWGNNDCPVNLGSISLAEHTESVLSISSTLPKLCRGESTTLTATLQSDGSATAFHWANMKNTAKSVVVSPQKTTTYQVMATDEKGCAAISSINIEVEDCKDNASFDWVFFEADRLLTSGTDLIWKTTGTSFVTSYRVERSEDGRIFTPIGFVDVEPDAGQRYVFTDNGIITRTAYYRIVAIEEGGTEIGSSTTRVTSSSVTPDLKLFPNPVGQQGINVEFTARTGRQYSYQVYNSFGQLLQNRVVPDVVAGLQRFTVPTEGLPAGTYLLRMQNPDGEQAKTFVVRK